MAKSNVKSKQEIRLMRESCRIVSDVIKLLGNAVAPGVATGTLDRMAEQYIRTQGGEPAFKGYGTDKHNLYPASICTSIDSEIVHGIPDGRELREGEIISIDVGVRKDGYYGDGAWTFAVGKVSEEKSRLMSVTHEALYRAIAAARRGNQIRDISGAVQTFVESQGFSVVKELVGHGVGRKLHEEPAVPNFVSAGVSGGEALEPGMTLAIEPMVNAGSERVVMRADGWTVVTADGRPSAHYEHTVLITEDEPEILTK